MTKQLDDKDVSLDEYKKKLITLNNTYEKEIQELKKELKESKEYIHSNKKNKNMVLKKFNELYKEKQNYIKEKQIIEQELNKKEQEVNKKEQEFANNKKIMDNLNIEIKLLKDNDELRKLTRKIEGSKDSSTPTKIPKIVRKKDDKARTFNPKDFKKDSLPKYNEKSNRLRNLEVDYQNATEEKCIINLNKIQNIKKDNIFSSPEIKKLDIEQIEKGLKNNEFYEYELNISN